MLAFYCMGEFELIEKYFKVPHARKDVVMGPGDDCALLTLPPDTQLAVSTDTLVSGVHFFPDMDPVDLGYKALAVNLSDLAAMGAEPRWVSLALTLLSAYLMLFFPAMPWRRKRPVGRSGCSRGRNGATVMPRSAFGLVGAVRRLRVRAETRLAQDPGSTVAGRRPADLRDGAFGLGARGAICDRRDRRAGHARAPSNQTSLRRRAASQLASAITPAVARQSGSPPS